MNRLLPNPVRIVFLISFLPYAVWAENNLSAAESLKNRYFGIRHGESYSNIEKRVCSSMKAGTDPKQGLTERGKEVVRTNFQKWLEDNQEWVVEKMKDGHVRIVASPFSRTQDTANIVQDMLGHLYKAKIGIPVKLPPIRSDKDLRERFFGDFEGQSTPEGFWEKLNAKDEANPNQTEGNVEKLTAMETRVTQVVRRIEDRSSSRKGELVFIVSHSDPLSGLQNALEKRPPGQYVHIPRFKTAEIRELKLKANSD